MTQSIGNLALKLSVDGTALASGLSKGLSTVKSFATSVTAAFASGGASAILSLGDMLSGSIGSVASLGKEFLGLKTDMLSMLNVGVDFERQMSIVNAMTNATAKEFNDLREEARRLGRDTEFTAEQAASAMSQLAQHGFSTADILEGSKSVVALASVLKVDIPQAAIIASDAVGGFGLHAKDLQRVNDVIASMLTGANTGGADAIQDAFKYVATTAQVAGKSIEETSAALMVLNNAGIKGSEAGSALSRFMTKMSKQTPAAQKAMDELGISFEDAQGNFRDFGDIFDDLQVKLAKLGKAERLEYVSKIFDVRAGRAAAVFGGIEGAADAYRKNLERLKNASGTASNIAGKQLMNVWGAIKIVQSSWEGFIEAIYAGIQGPLRQGIDNLTGLINRMRDFVQSAGVQQEVGAVFARIEENFRPIAERINAWFAELGKNSVLLRQGLSTVLAFVERMAGLGGSVIDSIFGSLDAGKIRDKLTGILIFTEFFIQNFELLWDAGVAFVEKTWSEFSDSMSNASQFLKETLDYLLDISNDFNTAWSRLWQATLDNIATNLKAFGKALLEFRANPLKGFNYQSVAMNFELSPSMKNAPKVSNAASPETEELRKKFAEQQAKVLAAFGPFFAEKIKKLWAPQEQAGTALQSGMGIAAAAAAAAGAAAAAVQKGPGGRGGDAPSPFEFKTATLALKGSKEAIQAEMKFNAEQQGRGDLQKRQAEDMKKAREALEKMLGIMQNPPIRPNLDGPVFAIPGVP